MWRCFRDASLSGVGVAASTLFAFALGPASLAGAALPGAKCGVDTYKWIAAVSKMSSISAEMAARNLAGN
ncbi:hypothetical protein HYH03_017490 [Edaphochlamys debaryana]|uniref:Uncharacterized protein n=1 Tax=Edaphochlamys debaryana TaxID=47281 RepID=A0A836BQK4_9CHLO|nr:hypothetical protein HYH03_017490 [Edaphochlamys debaryana]|eukprot:KAG2483688.1 hypothetical protein HYH03_017490 [Edaphochlamys debaryana]